MAVVASVPRPPVVQTALGWSSRRKRLRIVPAACRKPMAENARVVRVVPPWPERQHPARLRPRRPVGLAAAAIRTFPVITSVA